MLQFRISPEPTLILSTRLSLTDSAELCRFELHLQLPSNVVTLHRISVFYCLVSCDVKLMKGILVDLEVNKGILFFILFLFFKYKSYIEGCVITHQVLYGAAYTQHPFFRFASCTCN